MIIASWEAIHAYHVDTGERVWSQPVEMTEVVTTVVGDDEHIFAAGGSVTGRTVAMRLPDVGERPGQDAVIWSTKRAAPSCVSPILHRGHLFTLTDNGIMTCFEAATGRVLWRNRIGGKYYASLVLGDGNLYATDDRGRTTVVVASATFELLARNELGEGVFASPAIAHDCLFIRGQRHLYCLR